MGGTSRISSNTSSDYESRRSAERAMRDAAREAANLTRGLLRAASGGARRSHDTLFARRRSAEKYMPTNHRITLRETGCLSTPGLPAVRMSTLSNFVLPSTFYVEPIDDDIGNTFHQAGGHQGSFRNDGPKLVKKADEREASFYEDAAAGMWPVQFLPQYFGRSMLDDEPAIIIENLTHGLRSPCVMDLKMGFQSVEHTEPSLFKRLRHGALDRLTGSKHSGVRLEGLSMYRTLEKVKMKGTKVQSHSVSANMGVSLQDVLTFFLTDESGVRTDIALRFQAHIEALLHYFRKYNRDRLFIGSSILLIFDNDNSAAHMRWARALQRLHTLGGPTLSPDRLATLTRRTRVDVRMIDFAHTGPFPSGQQYDDGYIQGLHTILTALKAIRADRKRPIFTMASAAFDAMSKKQSEPSFTLDADVDDEHLPTVSESEMNFNFGNLYEQCSAVSTESSR